MAIIKCKMCGGDLKIHDGISVAECEYCGSRQTVPASDSEKKLIQFDRAERLRKNCEFDKAASLYEAIVTEFRQEAEAYWGLVLCKYGIEYVDDPATGKKIPTCHRSSFESVMDDTDLEQALENADVVARKVYRDEAKQIEEIRKGIIEVSGKEEPYDIFICYKETDDSGQRTIDSVLAQDLYDSLTAKSYRVFFARISLEDKLGQEYEPYIFAALNSAKIMLVVGTDYEYFNAVWVKNEWSRFLKLMATDKTKHLIPCYKNVDAYDMPKEFAKLQAQDLGKVGATQDLLRGIEKLLPKQEKPVTLAQEKVIVGGINDNKIASLLDRGNMALEDGDWAKADSFFEEVLNNDSKNAQAYLGKTLAMERCRTMYAFVGKRKSASQNAIGQQLSLNADQNHIEKQANQFSLPGYVEQDAIRKLYTFDLNYHSTVSDRKRQRREEEKYWAEHKLLSRAEKFASGVVAEKLAAEKKALFNALDDRIKKAQADEKTAKDAVLERYAQHLKKADEQAEVRYKDALARREKDYQRLVQIANNSANIQDLRGAAGQLEQLGDYQDSKNLAACCRKRADELVAKQAEEEARQKILRQKQEMAQRAKKKKKLTIATVAAVIVASIALMIWLVVIPNNNYNNAVILMDAGKYEEAIAAFEALDGYKDSEDNISECNTKILDAKYNDAVDLVNAENFLGAYEALTALDGYKDSAEIACSIYDKYKFEKLKIAKIGDYVLFGSYEQDNNSDNGPEEIEWQVLETRGSRILVISKYGLDSQLYNTTEADVTWETCSLRKWLNTDFYSVAFSDQEKAIIPSTVITHVIPQGFNSRKGCLNSVLYKSKAGNPTKDAVFLLSLDEANNYFDSEIARECLPTEYAIANGATFHEGNDIGSTCSWWLRSPGYEQNQACAINAKGGLVEWAFEVNDTGFAIRPALWIDLNF